MGRARKTKKKEFGAALTEYTLLVALLVFVVIASTRDVSQKAYCTMFTTSNHLAGGGSESSMCHEDVVHGGYARPPGATGGIEP